MEYNLVCIGTIHICATIDIHVHIEGVSFSLANFTESENLVTVRQRKGILIE